MKKPETHEYNPYFQKYIDLVSEGNFLNTLKQNLNNTVDFLKNIPEEKHNYRYAPGKWTIKEVFMHIMDTERVMAYRALVAARGDSATVLHYMEEDLYAKNANVSNRSMEDLLIEFKAIRLSSEKLYENVNEEQSKFLANAIDYSISARALGYIIIGHTQHHLNVIKKLYL